MAVTRRQAARTDICITVEKEGVWLYGNAAAFRQFASHMTRLARSAPQEHYELHVRWHLGSHSKHRNAVFVLMDEASRRIHKREDFEVTFMVVEPSDMKRFRRHERSGRLPSDWDRSV